MLLQVHKDKTDSIDDLDAVAKEFSKKNCMLLVSLCDEVTFSKIGGGGTAHLCKHDL